MGRAGFGRPSGFSHGQGFGGGFRGRGPVFRGGFSRPGFRGFAGFGRRPRVFFRFHNRFCGPFNCRFFGPRRFGSRIIVYPGFVDYGYPPYGYQPDYAPPAPQYVVSPSTDTVSDEAAQLDAQIARLTAAMDNLRQAEQARAAPTQPAPAASAEPPPKTVFVFRDQHMVEAADYAIVGSTLWILSPSRAKKIPLADLDLAATAKLNRERGVDFEAPGSK